MRTCCNSGAESLHPNYRKGLDVSCCHMGSKFHTMLRNTTWSEVGLATKCCVHITPPPDMMGCLYHSPRAHRTYQSPSSWHAAYGVWRFPLADLNPVPQRWCQPCIPTLVRTQCSPTRPAIYNFQAHNVHNTSLCFVSCVQCHPDSCKLHSHCICWALSIHLVPVTAFTCTFQ